MLFAGILDTTSSCTNSYCKLVTLTKYDINENWLIET